MAQALILPAGCDELVGKPEPRKICRVPFFHSMDGVRFVPADEDRVCPGRGVGQPAYAQENRQRITQLGDLL